MRLHCVYNYYLIIKSLMEVEFQKIIDGPRESFILCNVILRKKKLI